MSSLTKRFGTKAVDNVSFKVRSGEVFTLLGPSGCGKSTSLRCIAGLENPESGKITVDGMPVTWVEKGIFVPPDQRNVAMVFQSYALWPHMTVFDNIAFPLRIRKQPSAVVRERVTSVLELVRLSGLGARYPGQLSGGQQQRVALARALIYEPGILLLDEPLSNLDALLRESMRFELKELQRRLNLTVIYVTHDQEEASVVSDTICLLNAGRIEQLGTPREVYQRPANRFVAEFMGKSNILSGEVHSLAPEEHICTIKTSGGLAIQTTYESGPRIGAKVTVCIRPEFIDVESKPPSNKNVFQGEIRLAANLGDRIDYRIAVHGELLRAITLSSGELTPGEPVFVGVDPEHCIVIPEAG